MWMDPRLVGVRLDLDEIPTSIAAASEAIQTAVGSPVRLGAQRGHRWGRLPRGDAHRSGVEQIFTTNFFGPVKLTKRLLPGMRNAGRGRIVMVSSAGAIRGMPAIGAYSAAKGAIERWAESLSQEVAPFGLGVLGSGGRNVSDRHPRTHATTYADYDGPYGRLHAKLESFGDRFLTESAPGRPDRVRPRRGQSARGPLAVSRPAIGRTGCAAPHAGQPVACPSNLLQRITCRAIGAYPGAGTASGARTSLQTASVSTETNEGISRG